MFWEMPYQDRHEAGKCLARRLRHLAGDRSAAVLALPRGGVPVGYEIAVELGLPLDVFIVRKLGVPAHPELAMGAIASGGVVVWNPGILRKLGLSSDAVDAVVAEESRELARRETEYRQGREPLNVAGRTVILVDDGLATGASMRAAINALRRKYPARIIVAVPVGSPETCAGLEREADEVVCAKCPQDFRAVGQYYRDFAQTEDAEVRDLLEHASATAH